MARAAMKTAEVERRVGRPSKYRPEYCQSVQDYMGKGYSLTAFAGSIGIPRDTVYQWEANYPEFSYAIKSARGKRVEALERVLLEAETSPKVTSRIFALKNAAPDEWRDRLETDNTVNIKITHKVFGADEPETIEHEG